MTRDSPIVEARRMAVEIIRRLLPDPAWRIFVFGSRATGKAHARSDIDIGIEGPDVVPWATLAEIIDELQEAPTLYCFDVVDFKRALEDFRVVALSGDVEAP